MFSVVEKLMVEGMVGFKFSVSSELFGKFTVDFDDEILFRAGVLVKQKK